MSINHVYFNSIKPVPSNSGAIGRWINEGNQLVRYSGNNNILSIINIPDTYDVLILCANSMAYVADYGDELLLCYTEHDYRILEPGVYDEGPVYMNRHKYHGKYDISMDCYMISCYGHPAEIVVGNLYYPQFHNHPGFVWISNLREIS